MDVIKELKFLGKFTQKKKFVGGWGGVRVRGVRVDVNEELKFFVKIQKKGGGAGSLGGRVGGSGWMCTKN